MPEGHKTTNVFLAIAERVVELHTYLDPENIEGGSTQETLYSLEYSRGALLR